MENRRAVGNGYVALQDASRQGLGMGNFVC